MPIYRFRCKECKTKFEKLVGMVADSNAPVCPKCGSENLEQLITGFRSKRSQEDIMAEMEENFHGVNMDDPKSVTKAMKEMGSALKDEEDFGDNYDLMMDRAEQEVYKGAEKK
ncbi:MAG: zinc ribbon domain-containing protein [Abditibacteriota bacterium]|nr:zinc ribbon domain-containing protein [Abditibacteriota bacterium]